MPVSAVRTVSKARNGVGTFILQCKKLEFNYCDWAGSSRGMNSFLARKLPAFAQAYPQIEIEVSPRPTAHPIVRALYVNGRERVVCVRKLDAAQIMKKVEQLRDANGERLQKKSARKPVVSGGQESVRGVWSGLHAAANGHPWRI